jgi:hypothetical protein
VLTNLLPSYLLSLLIVVMLTVSNSRMLVKSIAMFKKESLTAAYLAQNVNVLPSHYKPNLLSTAHNPHRTQQANPGVPPHDHARQMTTSTPQRVTCLYQHLIVV